MSCITCCWCIEGPLFTNAGSPYSPITYAFDKGQLVCLDFLEVLRTGGLDNAAATRIHIINGEPFGNRSVVHLILYLAMYDLFMLWRFGLELTPLSLLFWVRFDWHIFTLRVSSLAIPFHNCERARCIAAVLFILPPGLALDAASQLLLPHLSTPLPVSRTTPPVRPYLPPTFALLLAVGIINRAAG